MAYHMVLPYCVAIIKNIDGDFLIGQHPNSERKPYPGYWDFPGGKLEDGETPEECIKREINEELGVVVTKLSLYGIFHHDSVRKLPDCTNNIYSLGICFECEIEGTITPTEQDNVHFANMEELHSLKLTPWARMFLGI